MTYAGAKGQTESAMKQVMHFGDNNQAFHQSFGDFALMLAHKDRSKSKTEIEVANALWLQENSEIFSGFKNTLKDAYKAQAIAVDFINDAVGATALINQTIAKQTHGEIPRLLGEPLPKSSRIVLTNALYFKSNWRFEFEEIDTFTGDFLRANNTSHRVSYMSQTTHLPYGEDEQKQFLLMPYRDNDFAALFVLPKAANLSDVEESLSIASYQKMLASLNEEKINFWLPKFALKAAPNITASLIDLGLGVAFDSSQANFTGINDDAFSERFYIADVVHQAVIKMFEAGTIATAATAVAMTAAALPFDQPPEKIIDFHVDHSFLFFIIHQPSQAILFMGRVEQPQDKG